VCRVERQILDERILERQARRAILPAACLQEADGIQHERFSIRTRSSDALRLVTQRVEELVQLGRGAVQLARRDIWWWRAGSAPR
jgi:hypothetical protein